jgi:hypothetical protein
LAANNADSYGFYSSVIYYDMEGPYSPEQGYSASYCSLPVINFLNGFVTKLHYLGYAAGIYGHSTNFSDFAQVSPTPDVAWFARYDGNPDLNVPAIGGWYSYGQRIKQYLGDAPATYPGWPTISIDYDFDNGVILAPPNGQFLAAPTNLDPNGDTGVTESGGGLNLFWDGPDAQLNGWSVAVSSDQSLLPTDPTQSGCDQCVFYGTTDQNLISIPHGTLLPGTKYYWTVRGNGTYKWARWSGVANLTTAPDVPYACGMNYNDYSYAVYNCTSSSGYAWDDTSCSCYSQQDYCGYTPDEYFRQESDCNAIYGLAWLGYPDCYCTSACPIILDIGGDGIQLTSLASGVRFPITNSDTSYQVSWTTQGSEVGFLVLDRNHDGTIDNGTELFGNFAPQPPSDTPNGFLALAEYDKPETGGNGDGIIDERDAIFSSLRVWVDINHNGIAEPAELLTLPAVGIHSISLEVKDSRRTDEYGNLFQYRAKVNVGEESDAGRWAYDVYLRVARPQ